MTRYSVQSRDQIFVKGYSFFPFAKNMGNNTGKNISKNLSGIYTQKLLGHAKQSKFKSASKSKSARLVIKLLIKLRQSQGIHHRTIEKQLQINMIKKYLKKETYLQKKDRKLLII